MRIHAIPGSKKEVVHKEHNEHTFTICVKEPAERNAANKRIRELVAEMYNVAVCKVKILTGHRSSTKILVVD